MNNEPLPQLQRPRAFVVRVVYDGQGKLHGQISEPSSADEWRATFTGTAELWRIFAQRIDSATGIDSTVVFDDERNVS